MKVIKPADKNDQWLEEPGRWRPARLQNGSRTAFVSCPECGNPLRCQNIQLQVMALSHRHLYVLIPADFMSM